MEFSCFLAFLTNIRGSQLVIIILAFLLLFGAKRLPDLARGLGRSIREFRKSVREVEKDFKEAMDEKGQAETTIASNEKTQNGGHQQS